MTDDLTSLVSALDMMERMNEMERWKQRAEAAEAELSKLDAVVHVLEIEDSYEDPAECVKALKAREAALREALEKYARHQMGCRSQMNIRNPPACDCGLYELRQALSNTKDKSDD